MTRNAKVGRTEVVVVDAPEHNQLIPVLDKALEAPLQRVGAALVWAGRTQKDAGTARPRVAFALDMQSVGEHARLRVLERVERHLRLIPRRRNEGRT